MSLVRCRTLLTAILVVAVTLRVVNYAALSDGPCLLHHRVSDMAFFEDWAGVIAGGDILTDQPLHPLHTWHRTVAAKHFAKHPEKLDQREDSPRRTAEPRAKDLWDEWYGGKRFHQEPLYPYTLALIRSLGGHATVWVHGLQMALGIASLLLLYTLTRNHFGTPAALLATAMGAVCAPLVFYELYLLRATPIAFATLLLALAFDRTANTKTSCRWFVFGLCTGIATALKSHFLPFGLVATGMLLWPDRARVKACLRATAWTAAGTLLALSPILLRNVLVGAPLASLTSVGAVTFANTNHVAYAQSGGFGWAESDAALTLLEQILDQSSGAFLATVSRTLATHPDVASYLGLLWDKFALVWLWAELPNNVNFYFARLHSTVLDSLPIGFATVAVTALAGLIGAFHARRLPRALLLFVVLALITSVVFYSLSRLRVPLVVVLLPFSGWGVVWLIDLVRNKRYPIAIATAVICALFAVFVGRPIPKNAVLLSSASYGNAMNAFYRPSWQEVVRTKNWARGAAIMQRAIATRPEYLDSISQHNLPNTSSKFAVTGMYSEVYQHYGHSLDELGRKIEAQSARTRASELLAAWEEVNRRLRKK